MNPWRFLVIIAVLQTFSSLAHYSFAPLGYSIQLDLGLSNTQLGSLATVTLAGAVATSGFSGMLIDRYGVRLMMLICPVIMVIALTVAGFTSSYVTLLPPLFLLGLGVGSVTPLTSKAIVDWFPGSNRGVAMSIKQSGVTLGGALGAALLPSLAETWSWGLAMQCSAFMLLVVVIASYTLYRDPETTTAKPAERNEPPPRTATVLLQPLVAGTLLVGIVFCGYQVMLQTFMVPYLSTSVGLTPVAAGGFLAFMQFTAVVVRPFIGLISDAMRRRVELLIGLGMIGGAAGMLLAVLARIPMMWLLWISALILGITAFGWVGLYFTYLTELVDRAMTGMISGVGYMANMIGAVIGPLLFGMLLDIGGQYGMPLNVFALVTMLCAGLLALIVRLAPQQRQAQQTQHA